MNEVTSTCQEGSPFDESLPYWANGTSYYSTLEEDYPYYCMKDMQFRVYKESDIIKASGCFGPFGQIVIESAGNTFVFGLPSVNNDCSQVDLYIKDSVKTHSIRCNVSTAIPGCQSPQDVLSIDSCVFEDSFLPL